MNTLSIIVPTLNEEEVIALFVEELMKILNSLHLDTEIIIVDDNSEDNTLKILKEAIKNNNKIRLIIRENEKGLSSAVMRGVKESKGNLICIMDADLSHPPSTILDLVNTLIEKQADMVIASRYLKNSSVKNWPLKRKLISKVGTIFSRLIINVSDPLSGFFIFRKKIIEGVCLNSRGSKICLEILARANFENKIIEIPYEFKERLAGKSKLNKNVFKETVLQILNLLFAQNSNFRKFFRFCLVGSLGLLLNITIFYILIKYLFIWYILAAVLSFGAVVTFNYFLNRLWTFGRKNFLLISYLKFVLISTIGLFINLIFLYFFVEYANFNYLISQILSIILAAIWNFYYSKKFVFNFLFLLFF